MANQIVIALQVNMRGATKVEELNRALKELRKSAAGLAKGLGGSNAALTSATKAARSAATAAASLAREEKNAVRGAQQTASARAKSARMVESAYKEAARVFAKSQRDQERDANKAAREIQTRQMIAARMVQKYWTDAARARMQSDRATQKVADTALRQRMAAERRAASEQMRILRQRQAAEQRIAALNANIPKSMHNLANRMREVQTGFDAIFRAGYRIQEVGRDLMQMGVRGMGAIKQLADEFGRFEFMVNRATGAMGLNHDATEDGTNLYARFKQRILETSRQLRLFAATDVAKAVYYWASATGQQVRSLGDMEVALKAVTPLMKVAAMTETDYETAIKGVYSISIQYGKRLSDVGSITEKLHQVTQRTAAEFPDLINSFKMVGPVAAANGVTFEEVANILGRLADAGIRGTMSGRGLRQFFIQTVRPSAIAKKALDDLWATTEKFGGKSFDEMVFKGGEFVGIDKYVNLLAQALQGATQAQRNFYLARITTANELPILTALVGKEIDVLNGVSEGWDKTKEASEEAAEGFRQSWEKLANSWLGVVGAVQRGVESLRIIIGGRIAAVLSPALEAIAVILEDMIKWVEDPRNQDVIDFFIKVAAGVTALLAAGGGMMLFVGSIINLGGAIAVVARVFGPLLLKFTGFGSVVAALAVAVVRNFDYIKKAISEAVENISVALLGPEKDINRASDAFKELGAAVIPVFDFIIRRAADAIVLISRFVRAVMEFGPLADIIKTVAQGFVLLFTAKTMASVLGLTRLLGLFHKTVVPIGPTMGLTGRMAAVMAGNMSLAGRAMGVARVAASGLLAAFGPIGLAIAGISLAMLAVENDIGGIKGPVEGFFEMFSDKAGAARDRVADLRSTLGDVGTALEKNIRKSEEFFRVVGEAARQKMAIDAQLGKAIWDEGYDIGAHMPWSFIPAKGAADAAPEEYIADQMARFQSIIDKYSETVGIDPEILFAKVREYVGKGYSEKHAISLADSFFAGWEAKYAENDKKAAALMAKFGQAESGKIGITPFRFGDMDYFGKDMLGPILASLNAEKESFSPKMRAAIDALVADPTNKALQEAFDDVVDQAEAEAPKAWSGVATAIVNGAKELRNIETRLEEFMKDSVSFGSGINFLIKSLTENAKNGFKDAKGNFSPAMVAFFMGEVQNGVDTLAQMQGTMSTPDFTALVEQTAGKFVDGWDDIWDTLPPSLKTEIEAGLLRMYQLIDPNATAVPQEILNDLYDGGKEMPVSTAKGVTDNTGVVSTAVGNVAKTARRGIDWEGEPEAKGRDLPTEVARGIAAAARTPAEAVRLMRENANAKLDPGNAPNTHGGKIPTRFAAGMRKNRGEVTRAASSVAGASKGVNSFVSSAYNWGAHLIQNFAKGMRDYIYQVQNAARRAAGVIAGPLEHTTPREGPLKNDDVWGRHFAENISAGIYKGIPGVQKAAYALANAASLESHGALSQGVTFESSNSKVIKVQVEVTSPDGSVDRIKTSQLERSLATSDLVLAIEHMSTVG